MIKSNDTTFDQKFTIYVVAVGGEIPAVRIIKLFNIKKIVEYMEKVFIPMSKV